MYLIYIVSGLDAALFGYIYACIQFEADKENHGVEIYPKQYHYQRAYGAVNLVVVGKIVYIIGKDYGGEQHEQGSQRTPH